MKNESQKQMPEVVSKSLSRYMVVRKAVVEIEFEVYAESEYEAQKLVEEMGTLVNYTDTMGAEVNEEYYDANGYVPKIEYVNVLSSWWEESGMNTQKDIQDTKEIFKLEHLNWEDEHNVYESQEECIEAWKDENGIVDEEEEEED